jgi:hypothetical protein
MIADREAMIYPPFLEMVILDEMMEKLKRMEKGLSRPPVI